MQEVVEHQVVQLLRAPAVKEVDPVPIIHMDNSSMLVVVEVQAQALAAVMGEDRLRPHRAGQLPPFHLLGEVEQEVAWERISIAVEQAEEAEDNIIKMLREWLRIQKQNRKLHQK